MSVHLDVKQKIYTSVLCTDSLQFPKLLFNIQIILRHTALVLITRVDIKYDSNVNKHHWQLSILN